MKMEPANEYAPNKRLAALMLALCLALCASAALADAPNEAEVIRIATEAVRAQVTLTDEEWGRLQAFVYETMLEGHSASVWCVEFLLRQEYSQRMLYSVIIESKSGGVLLINAAENANSDALLYEEGFHVMEQMVAEKGDMYYWTQQEVVDYYGKYGGGMFRMPGEGDLSTEQAIEIAKQYAIDTWGMSVDYLNGLHTAANLTADTEEQPSMWYVYFVDESIRSDTDGNLSPHIVHIDNASGVAFDGFKGTTHSKG